MIPRPFPHPPSTTNPLATPSLITPLPNGLYLPMTLRANLSMSVLTPGAMRALQITPWTGNLVITPSSHGRLHWILTSEHSSLLVPASCIQIPSYPMWCLHTRVTVLPAGTPLGCRLSWLSDRHKSFRSAKAKTPTMLISSPLWTLALPSTSPSMCSSRPHPLRIRLPSMTLLLNSFPTKTACQDLLLLGSFSTLRLHPYPKALLIM